MILKTKKTTIMNTVLVKTVKNNEIKTNKMLADSHSVFCMLYLDKKYLTIKQNK